MGGIKEIGGEIGIFFFRGYFFFGIVEFPRSKYTFLLEKSDVFCNPRSYLLAQFAKNTQANNFK